MSVTDAADRLLIPPLRDAAALYASRIDAPVRRLAGATMGTGWSLAFAATEAVDNAAVVAELEAAFELVIGQMSNWEPGSDICAFNRAAPGWRELKPEFFEVLAHALEVARLTDGAFDPALAAEVDALGFGPSGEQPRTTDAQRGPPLCLTPERGETEGGLSPWAGWRAIRLDRETRRAFQPGGVGLDLSSIAKGYAVDLSAARLRGLGVPSFLMEIGGEFRGQGVRPDGQPWRVELNLSEMAGDRIFAAMVDISVATSGDFVRRRINGRSSISHILDGRTRRPVDGSLSGVSVLHSSCMRADAWATGLMALGLERGLAVAEEQGLAAVFAARGADGPRHVLTSKASEMLG